MAMLWNFSEWMGRLGLQRQAQPELIYGVQPVVIMGDQSALVSPVLPPMAWAGGRRTATAAVFSAFELTSQAAGGTFIRHLFMSGDPNVIRFRIGTAPAAMANLIALEVQNMAPDPVTSLPRLGTLAAQPLTLTAPDFEVIAGGTTQVAEGFYLQPGFTIQFWATGVNSALDGAMLYEDLPATVPRA